MHWKFAIAIVLMGCAKDTMADQLPDRLKQIQKAYASNTNEKTRPA